MVGNERATVQDPLIRYAVEAGWTYLSRDEALRLRRGETGAVLHEVLVEQLQRLNPDVVDLLRAEDLVKRLARLPATIEGNLQAWEYLKGLKTVFVPSSAVSPFLSREGGQGVRSAGRERNVSLLDAVRVERNTFHVTDEFSFTNGVHSIRADVVFLVNGLPVLLGETKAATHAEGIAEAMDQVRRYHRETPELTALLQLFALTHLIRFFYGATWSLAFKSLFNWREEQAGDFETLVKSFVAPERILRLLSEFILFPRKDGELSKVVLRPHQMRAAERVLLRAADPVKRHGLIWHTQGSGKTYTMIIVARMLIEDAEFENPTVLMLIDRNELESQLAVNLEATGFGHVEAAQTRRHLRELLQSDRRGLIVSMIHKFDGIPANINTHRNVFILVDEAHRTTGGDLGNYLMGALPNATYIGFTGTPIDQTAHGKGTFKVFGVDDPNGYLDKYSIRESIEDGTTVPLHYALAPNDLLIDREVLEREFLALRELEGVSDVVDLNRVLDRAVTLKNMLKNRERVERVGAFVADHFRKTIEPMGYKAFLVGVDREACTLYKRELDRYLPPEYSAVVISRAFNDSEEMAQYHLQDDEEERIRKAFRRAEELPKILIVTEKLLTGFDAPILYCMYLDKPMRDHVLLQAIARVNRPYEDGAGHGKPSGFVLDFVGIFDKLEKALAFDSEDVKEVIDDLGVLRRRFETLMAEARADYLPLAAGRADDKQTERILERFRDREVREQFYKFYAELEQLYKILSPDEFLRRFMEDYAALTRIYQIVRSNYDPGADLNHSFMRKTAQLVQRLTESGMIQAPTLVYEGDAEALEKIAAQHEPDTLKVFNLIKAIHQLVADQGAHQPHLIPIGERAEAIAKAFEERQLTTQQALGLLVDLTRERKLAEEQQVYMALSPAPFAVYRELDRQGIGTAERIARQTAAAFEQHPHWRTSPEQEAEVRKALYKALLGDAELQEAGVDRAVELAERLMTLLRAAAA